MSRNPKPYIKCEKRAGMLHITAVRSTGRHLVPVARAQVAVGDEAALAAAVTEMIENARK